MTHNKLAYFPDTREFRGWGNSLNKNSKRDNLYLPLGNQGVDLWQV